MPIVSVFRGSDQLLLSKTDTTKRSSAFAFSSNRTSLSVDDEYAAFFGVGSNLTVDSKVSNVNSQRDVRTVEFCVVHRNNALEIFSLPNFERVFIFVGFPAGFALLQNQLQLLSDVLSAPSTTSVSRSSSSNSASAVAASVQSHPLFQVDLDLVVEELTWVQLPQLSKPYLLVWVLSPLLLRNRLWS